MSLFTFIEHGLFMAFCDVTLDVSCCVIPACLVGTFGQNCSQLRLCLGLQEQRDPVIGKCSCSLGYYRLRCELSESAVNKVKSAKTYFKTWDFVFHLAG